MKTRVFSLFLALALLTLLATPLFAGSLSQAKVALHLKAFSSKNICLPASQGGEAPDLTPCSQYVIAGQTGTGYNAYLIVVAPSSASEHPGVAGLSCGIDYDPDPLQGVDVFSWTPCSDLEFPNAGAFGEWPASGGGNRLTYDYTQNCQLTTVPGYESEGVVAVFGAFYVYAYGADVLAVTPNMNLMSGPELVVGDCSGAESALLTNVAGSISFSSDGTVYGCNPCLQDCVDEPGCSVPAQLDFVSVLLGETKELGFYIENTDNSVLTGHIPAGCGEFQVVEGAGDYSLAPGETRHVTVRYEATSSGYKTCDLYIGGLCPTVRLIASTPPPCTVLPTAIYFGQVVVGDSASAQFVINNNTTGDLVIDLGFDCPDFSILEGTGPFTIPAGQYRRFTAQFMPTAAQSYSCTVSTTTGCSSVVLSGTGLSPTAVCYIAPASLNFGYVEVNSSSTRSFTITNYGADALTGSVTESCANFSLVSGGGTFSLATGETRTVQVRFSPVDVGATSCVINVTGGCNDVAVSGYGTSGGPTTQTQAAIAVHATAHASKGECANAPTSPCSEYDVRWPLNSGCDLWLVVVHGAPPGIAGLSCGILYQDGQVGGMTKYDGQYLDVYSWTLCTSGLEFPNGYSGAYADEWPASGGGNRITWDASVDCQTTDYGYDGIHAVAGYFYVYAYSDDSFEITPNNNLQSGPEFQVGDCNYAVFDLPYPLASSVCGFGASNGYNPCGNAVSVRLLSFTAERVDAGAEVRWVVAGADEGHLGFDVYRGLSDGDRVKVSSELLGGRESYVFVDDDPPSTAVSYWLAERSRAGETTWHGPVELAAASMPQPGLLLRHASPNPFLNATRIAFRTGTEGAVSVRVYDTAGREVARPFTGQLPAGEHEIAWDGRDDAGRRLSAGVYLYRVQAERGGGVSGKVVLIR